MIGIGCCGQESPSPGGARSQGKGRKVNTGPRGLALRSGFPLAAERPLYSGLVDTNQTLARQHTLLTDITAPSVGASRSARGPPYPHSEGGPPSPRSSLHCSPSDGYATIVGPERERF